MAWTVMAARISGYNVGVSDWDAIRNNFVWLSPDGLGIQGQDYVKATADSAYVQVGGTNPAGAGSIRLRNASSIAWRNAANSANVTLGIGSSNELVVTNWASTTSASAGSASALPGVPAGYFLANKDGVPVRIPYWLA